MGRPARLQPKRQPSQGPQLLLLNTKRPENRGSRQIFCRTQPVRAKFFRHVSELWTWSMIEKRNFFQNAKDRSGGPYFSKQNGGFTRPSSRRSQIRWWWGPGFEATYHLYSFSGVRHVCHDNDGWFVYAGPRMPYPRLQALRPVEHSFIAFRTFDFLDKHVSVQQNLMINS